MKKLMIAVMVAAVAVLATASSVAAQLNREVIEAIDNIKIITPGEDVPPEIANLSKKWHGTWHNNFYQSLESILVVVQLDQKAMKARVINAWGGQVWSTGSLRAGYRPITADLEEREGRFFISFDIVDANNRIKYFRFSLKNGKNEGQELEGELKVSGTPGYWWVSMKPIP